MSITTPCLITVIRSTGREEKRMYEWTNQFIMSHSNAVVATCQSLLEEILSSVSCSRLTVIYSSNHLETTRSSLFLFLIPRPSNNCNRCRILILIKLTLHHDSVSHELEIILFRWWTDPEMSLTRPNYLRIMLVLLLILLQIELIAMNTYR